jgi:hypothetical protein
VGSLILLSKIQSTPFSFKLRKSEDSEAVLLQASGVIEVLLSKTQRSSLPRRQRGRGVFLGVITFRKRGEFDFAEQNSKHPIFLQTEEI